MQGKSINGYRLQKPLGTGGMAEVWYAENSLGKNAAVKFLKKELCGNPDIVTRFRNEAQVMVKLNHPNIRQVYGYGDVDGRPAIIMEYLEGDDLKAKMKKGERFGEQQLEKWWNQMADALNYTHGEGVVHRDIKPSNIFIDTKGNVRLLDFGIAKVTDLSTGTLTGSTLGTRIYMSPEQVKDPKRVDYRTDVYSLAVTFVHLLTGKAPYNSTSSSDFEIQLSIVQQPLDLSALPAAWRSFLKPYLAKASGDRPALKHFEVPVQQAKHDDATNDENTVYDESKTHWLSFDVQPKNAMLMVDFNAWFLTNGWAERPIESGNHSYFVSASGYKPLSGVAKVGNADVSIKVNLEREINNPPKHNELQSKLDKSERIIISIAVAIGILGAIITVIIESITEELEYYTAMLISLGFIVGSLCLGQLLINRIEKRIYRKAAKQGNTDAKKWLEEHERK